MLRCLFGVDRQLSPNHAFNLFVKFLTASREVAADPLQRLFEFSDAYFGCGENLRF